MGQKPLTMTLAQALADGNRLQGLEKEYFLLMSSHNIETDSEKKKLLMRRMLDLLKYITGRIECSDADKFLSNPRIPALQVLLSFTDLERTPQKLSELLQENEELVTSWLQTLQALGLAEQNPNIGHWQACHTDFKISDKPGSVTLQKYHFDVLTDSAHAVALPAETRKFRALMLPLSQKQYAEFCEKLNEVFTQLLAQYSSPSLDGKRLYRFNMALVPLTPTHLSSSEHKTAGLLQSGVSV